MNFLYGWCNISNYQNCMRVETSEELRLFLSAETFTKAAHTLLLSFAVDVGSLERLGSHSVAVFAVWTAGVGEHTLVLRVNQ